MPLAARKSDGEAARRPAARVQAVDRAGLRVVVDDEQVAADAVAGRLHQADGGVGGDGRVDGVAAALENLHAGARRQRLARGDDPEGRRDDRAPDDRAARSRILSRSFLGEATDARRTRTPGSQG